MRARAALIAAAAAAALVPLPPAAVERAYSTGAYAAWQRVMTSASNVMPFALLDAAIVCVAAAWIALAVRDWRHRAARGRWHALAATVARTLAWAAALYLLFLAAWGLNYRRERLEEKLAFSADAVQPAAALAMAGTVVEQTNALHAPAHAAGWEPADRVDPALAQAVRTAVQQVGGRAMTPARPKRTMLDWYFRRTAVSGMTDPYFLETLVATDVLPFERPIVIAHEWAHLAGITDEGEANFVAWVACVRATARDRYSAWLFLFQEMLPSLRRGDRAAVAARLAEGPRSDLRASRERYERNVSPRLSAAGWRVYDSYLKANRVEAGAASYAEVVKLVLGVRFGENWTPLRR